MIAFLLEKKADKTSKAFRIDKSPIFIGRGQENDFVINHPSVSTKHAKISIRSDGKFYIEDLKSSNGTFVNRERISIFQLKNGDEILLGVYPLEFIIEGLEAKKIEKRVEEKPREKKEERKVKKQSVFLLTFAIFILLILAGVLFFIRSKPEKKGILSSQTQEQRISDANSLINEGKKFFEDAMLFKDSKRYKDALESLELSVTYFDEALLSDPENQIALDYKRKIQKELDEMPSEGVAPKVWKAKEEKIYEDNEKGNEIVLRMEIKLREAENLSKSGEISKALSYHREVVNLLNELKKLSISEDILKKGEILAEKSKAFIASNYFEVGYYFLLSEYYTIKKAYEENQIFRTDYLCKKFIEKSNEFIKKNKRFEGERLSKIMELNKNTKQMRKEISKKVELLRSEAEALFNEGVLLEKVGSYSSAIQKWKLALEKTNPEDKELIKKIKDKISQYEE
ncbi:MAG: FHA domain-containing protein [Candidatus Aminicenantia bacterium]